MQFKSFLVLLVIILYCRAPIIWTSKIWNVNNPDSSQAGKNMLKYIILFTSIDERLGIAVLQQNAG